MVNLHGSGTLHSLRFLGDYRVNCRVCICKAAGQQSKRVIHFMFSIPMHVFTFHAFIPTTTDGEYQREVDHAHVPSVRPV